MVDLPPTEMNNLAATDLVEWTGGRSSARTRCCSTKPTTRWLAWSTQMSIGLDPVEAYAHDVDVHAVSAFPTQVNSLEPVRQGKEPTMLA